MRTSDGKTSFHNTKFKHVLIVITGILLLFGIGTYREMVDVDVPVKTSFSLQLERNSVRATKLDFIYLIQGLNQTVARSLYQPGRLVFQLSFKDQDNMYPEEIHLIIAPDSTWNTGRNMLGEYAMRWCMENNIIAEYYIFLDEDVAEQTKPLDSKSQVHPFDLLAAEMKSSKRTVGYLKTLKWIEKYKMKYNVNVDAQLAIYHRSVIGSMLFPYTTKFDDQSWYYSQVVINFQAPVFNINRHGYENKDGYFTTDYNTERHASYPKRKQYSIPREYVAKSFRSDTFCGRLLTRAHSLLKVEEYHHSDNLCIYGNLEPNTWVWNDKLINDCYLPDGEYIQMIKEWREKHRTELDFLQQGLTKDAYNLYYACDLDVEGSA